MPAHRLIPEHSLVCLRVHERPVVGPPDEAGLQELGHVQQHGQHQARDHVTEKEKEKSSLSVAENILNNYLCTLYAVYSI